MLYLFHQVRNSLSEFFSLHNSHLLNFKKNKHDVRHCKEKKKGIKKILSLSLVMK